MRKSVHPRAGLLALLAFVLIILLVVTGCGKTIDSKGNAATNGAQEEQIQDKTIKVVDGKGNSKTVALSISWARVKLFSRISR